MTTAMTKPGNAPTPTADAIERVLISGDLAALSPEQRVTYYTRVCESVGLNPLTKPFAYITLNGKLVLYALRDATDQLRKIHGVSIALGDAQMHGDVFLVRAKAQDATGRADESTGAVTLKNLTGEALANALMKAETKAKRRVTLSICGLGMLDETEVETIPGARREAEPVAPPPQRRSAAPAPAPAPTPAQAPASPAEPPVIDADEVPFGPDEEEATDDPRPAPVKVERAKIIKSGGEGNSKWTLYGYKFSDGTEATGFDSTHFDIATEAGMAGALVRYETQPGKKPGTLTLIQIERA